MSILRDWDETRTIQIELSIIGWDADPKIGEWYLDIQDLSNERQLPASLANMLHEALLRQYLTGDEIFDEIPADIFITFRSTGYYDPGNTYGPPEICYPPEEDDERTMLGVRFVYGDESREILLTLEEQNAIFAHYENEVKEYELE